MNRFKSIARITCLADCLLLMLSSSALGAGRVGYAPIPTQLVAAYNDFGFRLMAELEKSASESNLFFSPPNVAMTLALASRGAEGTTREAINRVIGTLKMRSEELADANGSLIGNLNLPQYDARLSVANSVWCRPGIAIEREFIDSAWSGWRAKVAAMDLREFSALREINAWVSSQTQGAIPEMVSGPIDPKTEMILASAIYFKAPWQHRFDTNRTRNLPFHPLVGGPVDHPTMFLENTRLQYFNPGGFQAVELPYSSGLISMYVFLPSPKSSITNFLRAANRSNWSSWQLRFRSARGTIGLPRFRADYNEILNKPLSALGMGIAFTPKADFGGISHEAQWIDRVVQKALVDVNEEGTTAAAATSLMMTRGGYEPDGKPFEMIVDRPFFFAIVDVRSSLVLFLGKIVNPATN